MLGLDTDNGKEFLNTPLLEYCRTEAITFTRGRAYKKNDQCFVEQKNGVVVRQLVGYDRLEGPRAYQQLGEVYRAVRLYVNFFQPSMKLVAKRRDGAKVSRTYDAAQTPWQRLLAAGRLSPAAREQLTAYYHSLNPVRLLAQLERLQDALWQHARIHPSAERAARPEAPPLPEVFQHSGARGEQRERGEPSVPLPQAAAEAAGPRPRRKYRRSDKPRVPHTWRTRVDPFAAVWEEIETWLAAAPERTAKSLFEELQTRYPGAFSAGQLRTLQRRVKAWRREAILTFDAGWLEAERCAGAVLPGPLRATPAVLPAEPPGTGGSVEGVLVAAVGAA